MTPGPVGRVPGGVSAAIVLAVALCTGCASVTPKVEVRQPTTTLPAPGAIRVTIEPQGGSPQPTGEPCLAGGPTT